MPNKNTNLNKNSLLGNKDNVPIVYHIIIITNQIFDAIKSLFTDSLFILNLVISAEKHRLRYPDTYTVILNEVDDLILNWNSFPESFSRIE